MIQSHIEVYGIRDQKPEKGRDQGTQPWDLESQPVGSGSVAFFAGSTKFCGFRDQNSHRFRAQGSKFWVKVWDQLRKKYLVTTLL